MEYYSAIKKEQTIYCSPSSTDEFQDNYAEWKKVHKKGYMPSDSIYTKSWKLQTRGTESRSDRAWGGLSRGTKKLLGVIDVFTVLMLRWFPEEPLVSKLVGPHFKYVRGPSLVVQGLRIHLPVQGTQVRSLVEELRYHMPRGNQVHVPQLEKACMLWQRPSAAKIIEYV